MRVITRLEPFERRSPVMLSSWKNTNQIDYGSIYYPRGQPARGPRSHADKSMQMLPSNLRSHMYNPLAQAYICPKSKEALLNMFSHLIVKGDKYKCSPYPVTNPVWNNCKIEVADYERGYHAPKRTINKQSRPPEIYDMISKDATQVLHSARSYSSRARIIQSWLVVVATRILHLV